MSNGRLSWEIVGIGRRSSRLCLTGSVASPPASLTPPSGRAKALVRGEADVGPGVVVSLVGEAPRGVLGFYQESGLLVIGSNPLVLVVVNGGLVSLTPSVCTVRVRGMLRDFFAGWWNVWPHRRGWGSNAIRTPCEEGNPRGLGVLNRVGSLAGDPLLFHWGL